MDCPQEVNEYEGFEIIYRNYFQVSCIVNVTMENMTPEDIYQVFMKYYFICGHLLISKWIDKNGADSPRGMDEATYSFL